MSRGGANGTGAIALEQLIALNDEMAALVRAGVPLEQGLLELGRDLPGGVGQLAVQLGQQLNSGTSLAQILARDADRFPPVWRSVVEAGLRSGNLSAALEGLSTTARRVAELRRVIGMALIYPLVVVSLAYLLFVFTVTQLVPRVLYAIEDMTRSSDALLSVLTWLGQTAAWWGLWPPIVVMVVLVIGWNRSGKAAWTLRSATKGTRRTWARFGWPSIRQALHDGRMATFAELLSLLVEHKAALPEAVVLAADASGDRALGAAARTLAQRLQAGEVLSGPESVPPPFPPYLGWLLATCARQTGLSHSLRLNADIYRQRAARAATWNAVYLPILLTVILGGAAVFCQALMVFGPVCRLLYSLG